MASKNNAKSPWLRAGFGLGRDTGADMKPDAIGVEKTLLTFAKYNIHLCIALKYFEC